jgi:hypothetical protein
MRQASTIAGVTLAGFLGNSIVSVADGGAGVLISELVLIGLLEAKSGLPI